MESGGHTAGHARRRSASLLQNGANHNRQAGMESSNHNRETSASTPEHEGNKNTDRFDEEDERSTRRSSSDWEMDDMHSDEGLEDDEETGLTKHDRQQRKKRKRRNTMPDARVVPDDIIAEEEKKIASQNFIRASLINGLLIALWYIFSISISVYNKWMFSKDNLNFHFPLFTTCMHMVVQFTLAALVLYFVPSLRPRHDPIDPRHVQYAPISHSQQEEQPEQPQKPLMTKWFYFTRVGPCGAATGLDIGLGNTSLKFISLTFFTMCKSSVLAFVLIFAFLFRLEKPSWKLGGIILVMTIGVVMMVAGETAFNALGFILVMTAAFFSGFRWSLTQILLLRNPATSNPFSSIFFLAPVMFFALLVIALPAEGPAEVAAGFRVLADAKGIPLSIAILLFPGALAFLMTASEFALLKRTSVVTLSVCGIFKEVLTISAASIIFHDQMTPINISGLIVTIAAIAAYNYIKVKKMREGARREAHAQIVAEPPAILDASEGGDVGRKSTSGLIRNSLSIQTAGAGADIGGDRERTSPLKRPEDLE